MKRLNRIAIVGGSSLLIASSVLFAPFSALAASISASVSASTINSLGDFRVTMTSSGVSSCTWSRLDNNTTWQWKDQPLPSGTAYDSGIISGWAGPSTYEWQFNCTDGMGGQVFAATSVTISAETGSIFGNINDLLSSVINSVITNVVGPSNSTTPEITVLPTPLVYPDTPTNEYYDMTLTVSNTGGAGSLLTGSLMISGDPAFSCISGCSYTNVAPGIGPNVVIRFSPSTVGTKTATLNFSGGSGAVVPASGNGIAPTVVIVAAPNPVIDVSPVPTLFFYGVEMGDHRDKQFAVRNVGPAGTLLSGTVSVSGNPDFTCRSGCSYANLSTTDVHYVTMRFTPQGAVGAKLGVVAFTGGGNASRFVNGDAYILSISGNLDFSTVPVNQTKPMTFTVTNPSPVTDVGVGTIVVPPPFTCISGCTYNLPPGGSHTFTIGYTPTSSGPHTGTGSLSGFPNSSFNFTGNGVQQYFRMQEP